MPRLVALATAVALVAPMPAADKKLVFEPKAKAALGDIADILDGATKVECFRIKSGGDSKAENAIGGHAITATGKEQGKEFAAKLAGVMAKDATYTGLSAGASCPASPSASPRTRRSPRFSSASAARTCGFAR